MRKMQSRGSAAIVPSLEWDRGMAGLVGAIGDPAFDRHFTDYVHGLAGAELVFIFHFSKGEPVPWASLSCDGSNMADMVRSAYIGGEWWRFDEGICTLGASASVEPLMLKTDIKLSASHQLKQTLYDQLKLRDRVLICGTAADDILALSMIRSERSGPFDNRQLDYLAGISPMMLPLIAKHCDVRRRARPLASAFADLAEIERRVASAGEGLTSREAAVCARYLYGLSTAGIAIDLNIATGTVMTFRKRFYERLSIGSHRELMLWYLDQYARAEFPPVC